MRVEGLSHLNNPMTSSGLETATSYATAVRPIRSLVAKPTAISGLHYKHLLY
jgi:hypothetical protein